MKATLIVFSLFYYSVASAQITVDRHPVSNKNWSVFLQSIKQDPTLLGKYGQSMTPDQWGKAQTISKNQDAPVVGVSWQQALAYCEWRSVMATYLQTNSKVSTYQVMEAANTSAKTLIIYRLPSAKEWDKLASRFANESMPGIGFRCVRSVKKVA